MISSKIFFKALGKILNRKDNLKLFQLLLEYEFMGVGGKASKPRGWGWAS